MTKQQSQNSSRVAHNNASQTQTWVARDLAGSEFRDTRLNKRFRTLFEQLSEDMGESMPLVCQVGTATKAAYRFLSNQRVTEAVIRPHFRAGGCCGCEPSKDEEKIRRREATNRRRDLRSLGIGAARRHAVNVDQVFVGPRSIAKGRVRVCWEVGKDCTLVVLCCRL